MRIRSVGGLLTRALVAALAGCTGAGSTPTPPAEHPLDDVLSLAHAQAVGTHNSYHVETAEIAPWDYTHAPLDQQLVDQGVRQFELDLYWVDGAWRVFHLPILDEGTTCDLLADCLAALRTGSEVLGPHLPAMILLEIKQGWDADGEVRLQALDAVVQDALDGHLLTPADIQGDAPTLGEAMQDGWPVLAGQRGTFIPVVHEQGTWAETTRALGLPLFTDAYGDLTVPWAAVHSMNDPEDARIPQVIAAGHLVRTRADSDVEEALANDPSTSLAALASGATFVSTDFPTPHPSTGYVVVVPDGTPARCNPISAGPECTSEALEDPAIVGP